MTDEILDFLKLENERLIKRNPKSTSENRVLSRTVKIMEELGELSDEVLASLNDQRAEKLSNHKRENLEAEFADVLITTLLLALYLEIDINGALKSKIDKIKLRNY